LIRVKLQIKGRVQGVGFRSSTSRIANRLNLKGWVRNLRDGSVEAVVEGDEEAINKLIRWCKTGPMLAQVQEVKVEKTDATGEFPYFFVRR
jgi:acylphosphatase